MTRGSAGSGPHDCPVPTPHAWRTLASVTGENDQERATAEQAFAILTAKFHGFPELTDLLEELTAAEARMVVLWMASLLQGMLLAAEIVDGAPHGSAWPRIIAAARERISWL